MDSSEEDLSNREESRAMDEDDEDEEGIGSTVRAADTLAAMEQDALTRQQQEHKGVFAESLAHRLAARRMASMMTLSNVRFAAVPQGAHWIPQKHELNAGLSGGSVASHLSMAGDRDDTAERIARGARKGGSKLFFAPQSLVDHADVSDSDSEGHSPARRFAEIARNVNPMNEERGRSEHLGSPVEL